MSSLNPRNDTFDEAMKARTNMKKIERPKALTGTKKLCFEVLEYYRRFLNDQYKSKLDKSLKLLV